MGPHTKRPLIEGSFDSLTGDPSPLRDINLHIAGVLLDLASVQASDHSRRGYERASRAILNLEHPVDSLVKRGTLREVPYVGPASERVVVEMLQDGTSNTVDMAVARAKKTVQVAERRALRQNFLSVAEARRALMRRATGVVGVRDYRGDFQMHTEWSDGVASLPAMVDGCMAAGYRYACVTDHSYGLRIANGMSVENARRQHALIDQLNKKHRGRFRMFKGIEANILADGTVDMSAGELRLFELVVAAPHSLLRKPFDQTARMVGAVSQPGVSILGHPRGRKFNARAGIQADWDRVFTAAARNNVAVEIDGDRSRQDVDFTLAKRALRLGCVFALDSDAHSVDELSYAGFAVAHARLARIPPDRIVNCWDPERVLEWASAAWKR